MSSLPLRRHPHADSAALDDVLPGSVSADGSGTAGNASGLNDGACALLLASEQVARRHGLTPRACWA